MEWNLVSFQSDDRILNKAVRVAVGDIAGNVVAFKDGLLKEEKPCLMAGLDYITPWTRDTAINVWNALALISGEVSRNTLLSVLKEENGSVWIGGQYWDAMIWLIGAYEYGTYHNDEAFLKLAYEAGKNSIRRYEQEEFDDGKNLFRGPAVYGDGVSAYPEQYTGCPGNHSGILEWVNNPTHKKAEKGYGLPMFALSTNCVYVRCYEILAILAQKFGMPASEYTEKALRLKSAVNEHFWNEEKQNYDYLAGECDHTEGMGVAFAILFGIADEEKTKAICENTYVSPHGIPCVWPTFERYEKIGGLGRHSGTVWPHIQAFWALAMLKAGQPEKFEKELKILAENAYRDMHFSEIYHPQTGLPYGGLQENTDMYNPDCNYQGKSLEEIKNEYDPMRINEWNSLRKQTWSATGFLSLIFHGVLGISVKDGEVTFAPYIPSGCSEIKVSGLKVCGQIFRIELTREKAVISSVKDNENTEATIQ